MSKNIVRGRGKFKLRFCCVLLRIADGSTMRAAVLSVAEVGSLTHIMAGLALENGVVQQQVISRADFELAKNRGDCIEMVEADESNGSHALFGPDGRSLKFAD